MNDNWARLEAILDRVSHRFAPERGLTARYIAMCLDVHGVVAPDPGYPGDMATKKTTAKKPSGTKQETADSSDLGKKPTSTPDDKGPQRPADSPYAG